MPHLDSYSKGGTSPDRRTRRSSPGFNTRLLPQPSGEKMHKNQFHDSFKRLKLTNGQKLPDPLN